MTVPIVKNISTSFKPKHCFQNSNFILPDLTEAYLEPVVGFSWFHKTKYTVLGISESVNIPLSSLGYFHGVIFRIFICYSCTLVTVLQILKLTDLSYLQNLATKE